MPGFVTHYIFGRETYRHFHKPASKQILYKQRAAYQLGLQGPDLFFYYLPSYLIDGFNLGTLAHTTETSAFFQGLLHSYKRFSNDLDKDIAEAYLMGFLGHYTLDTVCHPFIYGRTHYRGKEKDYFSRHAYLETDIDTALLDMKLHRCPSAFHAEDTIALSLRQKKVVATMLYTAYHYAFPQMKFRKTTMYMAILSFRLGLQILHDNSGQKKVLFRLCEKHFLGHPVFSPLIPSDNLFFRTDPFNLRHATWTNPWDKTLISKESFFDLYQKAEELYLQRMEKLYSILHEPLNTHQTYLLQKDFFADYGNLSFHSGLSCRIPS